MTLLSEQFHLDLDPHGALLDQAAQSFFRRRDARRRALEQMIERLPEVSPSVTALNRDRVVIGRSTDLSPRQRRQLETALAALKPWRKGPFELFGIRIDSEWDSALKWQRVAPHMASLKGHRVLDVGCSNGYYMLRMTDHAPRLILGIEPYALYFHQFLALRHFLNLSGLHCLPLTLEEIAGMAQWFDTIFCMGILYHRRSPLETLAQLKGMLIQGGQLILETLILEGDRHLALSPRDRYACMRNVFFIPTVACLTNWLARCGFKNIRCVDISATSAAEQRKTAWIDSDSLDSFLDPENSHLTVEGYPAPVRAVVIAEAA